MRFEYILRKFVFRKNETLPSAGKLFLWQLFWIVPYLLLANYLERNLLPLRLLCYTQKELLSVPHGEEVDLSSCWKQFFPSSGQKFIERKKCLYEEPVQILITPRISRHLDRVSVVRSAPSAREYRNYIRETWKSDMEPDIPVIFVLGTDGYNPKEEGAVYQDIMQFDFVDSYFNLTLKITLVYKHFFENFPHLEEIIMINDDAIANATAIRKEHSLPNLPQKCLFLHLKNNSDESPEGRIIIRKSITWLSEIISEFAIMGSGFIVTRKAAERIVGGICSFPRFNLDDVFMGILAKCLSINMEHSDGFDEHSFNNGFIIFHYQWSRFSVAQLNFLYHKTLGLAVESHEK